MIGNFLHDIEILCVCMWNFMRTKKFLQNHFVIIIFCGEFLCVFFLHWGTSVGLILIELTINLKSSLNLAENSGNCYLAK